MNHTCSSGIPIYTLTIRTMTEIVLLIFRLQEPWQTASMPGPTTYVSESEAKD